MDKQTIRKEIIKQRLSLKQSQKLNFDLSISESLKSLVQDFSFKSVMGFFPKMDEINIIPFLEFTLENNLDLYLPRVNENLLEVCKVLDLESLVPNKFGILEPASDFVSEQNPCLDLILVPGLAFDLNSGHRIGYGKGFYDNFLQGQAGLKAGLTYEFQTKYSWAQSAHDIPVNIIISESGSYVI